MDKSEKHAHMNLATARREAGVRRDAFAAQRAKEGLRVSWLSLVVNIFLIASKLAVGILSGSYAMIADAVHSVVDLASDVAAIFGLKMAAVPRDENHPYGHHKFASLCALLIALSIFGFCVGLIYTSVRELTEGDLKVPGLSACWMALVAMIIKEAMYHYAHRQAVRLKSRILLANALDHRTDAVASLLVLVAVGVAHLAGPSWAFLDKLAGLILGALMGYESFKLTWGATQDLLDAAPSHEIINDLREHVLPVPGVLAYHNFRARRVGDLYEVDLHIQVAPEKTVTEGHSIADAVETAILNRHPEVLDVMVHVEPADGRHLRAEGIHGQKRTVRLSGD